MRNFGFAIRHQALSVIAYSLWVMTILAFAWATTPYLIDPINFVPPAWLTAAVRALFYRDYAF